MEFLLSKEFNVESNEVKNLIERIQTSYNEEDKEAFLKIGGEITDAVIGKGDVYPSIDETVLNENIFKVIQNLTDMQAMAFTQMLVRIKRENVSMNDILGQSDDIYRYLKDVSNQIDEEQTEEGLKIKQGKAFYLV